MRCCALENEVYARLSAVRDRHVERFWADPNVTGFGIGLLQRPGPRSYGIVVAVKSRAALTNEPSELDGVPVEFVEQTFDRLEPAPAPAGGETQVLESRSDVINPMIGGISVGPKTILIGGVGTLGLVVTETGSGNLLLLSNEHVMCGSSPAAGDPVYQPAKVETIKNYKAGELVRWHIGNVTHAGKEYGIDAAVAKPDPARAAPVVRRIYKTSTTDYITVLGSATAKLGDAVEKSGFWTNVTTGEVVALDFDTRNDSGVELKRQILCEAKHDANFAESGDSGSVVLSGGYVVGLLWGATTRVGKKAKVGTVSPIAAVMQHMQFTV